MLTMIKHFYLFIFNQCILIIKDFFLLQNVGGNKYCDSERKFTLLIALH